jgi:type II secretory pathway pseudopilin PulG
MRTLLALLASIAIASNAAAGVAYEFVTNIETSRYTEKASGRVWVEGDKYRAEVTRADGSKQGILSTDGDRSAMIYDLETRKWVPRMRVVGEVRSSAIFLFPAGRAQLTGTPLVTYKRGEPITIAGERAIQHVLEANFTVANKDGVAGTYTVVARLATSDELPPLPIKSPIRTGYDKVDKQLDAAAAKITGMVLRHELEITRTLDGGPPQTERTVTAVTRLERMEIPAIAFAEP